MFKQDFLQQKNGDLVIENGDFVLTTDKNVIPQRVTRALKLKLGEYWLDPNAGIPNLDPNNGEKAIEALLISTINAVPGVKSITEFKMKLDSIKITVNIIFKDDLNQEHHLEIDLPIS